MKKFLASVLVNTLLLCNTGFMITHAGGEKKLNVPYRNQNDVVSGCEAVSATMVLDYYGYNISSRDFVDNFLTKVDWQRGNGNTVYGPDPYSAYVGNPYICNSINCGYGCFAPVIEKSLNRYLENKNHIAFVTTGTNLEDLVECYINDGVPVLIWATINMIPSREGDKWIISYIDENAKFSLGDLFTWRCNEHCLVLIGYDQDNYYFNDPYKNNGVVSFPKLLVEERFLELGMQSVVVLEK